MTDALPDLTLLVRGAADRPQPLLEGRTPLEAAAMPGLCRLGRRGRQRPLAVAPGEDRVHAGADLFAALGFSLSPDADPPHAAAVWYGAGEDPAAGPAFLHLDPVHLFVTLEGSRLADPGELALRPEEVSALTQLLDRELFAPEGWSLHPVRPDTWVLALPEVPAITTRPPQGWLGGDARAGLPEGPAGGEWQRRLNEVQMLLAGSSVNGEREHLGLPPVNSLWAWGGGGLPAAPERRYERVLGGGLAAAGLARATGSGWQAEPADYAAWRTGASGNRDLVVCDEAREASARADPEAKAAALERLDSAWLTPALEDLKRGRLGSLYVVLGPVASSGPGEEEGEPASEGLVVAVHGGRRWVLPRRCPVSERSPRGQPCTWSGLAV